MLTFGTPSDATVPRRLERCEPTVQRFQEADPARTVRVPVRPVLRTVEHRGWCSDGVEQLSAALGSTDGTSREVSRPHPTCPARAAGRGLCRDRVVDETLKDLACGRHVPGATA